MALREKKIYSLLGCVGAIIGAGFVSGREIVSFFSRYKNHSWWLIGLSVVTMIFLCCMCMRNAEHGGELPFSQNFPGRICLMVMLLILAGSMTAAAGHMISLLLPTRSAYLLGVTGTLCIAWLLSKGSMKPYSILSFALTAVFLWMIFSALNNSPQTNVNHVSMASSGNLVKAGLYAVGYGAMNIAVSMGVLCRNGQGCTREKNRKSLLLGFLLGALLFVSNTLYLRNPQVINNAFPIVPFFSTFGRIGYMGCLLLLYLAILTTLIALVLVLRSGFEQTNLPKVAIMPFVLGLPAAISCVGFEEIVDHLYAPGGLLCFVILILAGSRNKKEKAT